MLSIPSEILQKCEKIKLIFFDIDGTLLNEHGQWGEDLPKELGRLHNQGIKLAVASGRPSFAAQFIFDVLPITDAGLFCTGAQLYDPVQKNQLKVHTLELKRVAELYEKAKGLGVYTEFYTQEAFFVPQITDVTRIHAEHLRVQPLVVPSTELLQQTPSFTKLLLGNDERIAPGQLELLAEAFPDMEFAFANFLACPGWRFASVISRAACKKAAFNSLLEYHDVKSEEVAAFGDSHSDEVFIEQAGLGVAMGNATSEVLKRKADYITASVDHGGVEKLLKYIGTPDRL